MFPRSIRWRLQLWLAFLLTCILSGFGLTAYQLHRTNRLAQIDDELERRVLALAGDVRGIPPFGPFGGPPPLAPNRNFGAGEENLHRAPGLNPFNRRSEGMPPQRPGRQSGGPWEPNLDFLEARAIYLSAQTAELFDPPDADGFYFALWSRSGTLLQRSTNAPSDLTLPDRTHPFTASHTRMLGARRETYQFTEIGECVLAGRFVTGDLEALRGFAWWLAAAGAAVLTAGLGGGWWLVTRAIRPVEEISATARRISAGNLTERIAVTDPESELGQLAGVLNSTFARLEDVFAQQRQFTADASHELRTPIAVLISEAQSTLARERSAADYRAALESCLDTAQQMRRLSQSLLELARYDAGQEPVKRTPLDLAEIARAGVELVVPLARARDIQIHCDLEPTEVRGDADRLGQVIANLLTNAIQYNHAGGEVRVTTHTENGAGILTVADSGPGLAPEDLPHVFERFYRGDKSRTSADGHSGLGLAICQAIVAAHGGEIKLSSRPGAGSEFAVELPP